MIVHNCDKYKTECALLACNFLRNVHVSNVLIKMSHDVMKNTNFAILIKY